MMLRLGSLLFLLLALAAPAKAADAPAPLRFEITRNGSAIGRHEVVFRRDGDLLRVSIAIDIKVSLAGLITVFRYEHRNEEAWRGDRLVALESKSNNDGDAEFVRGKADGDDFAVDAVSGAKRLPGSAVSTTYWNPVLLRQSALLNSGDGTLMKIAVTSRGEESIEAGGGAIRAARYELAGDLNAELWYDAGGRWVKARFKGKDGSDIAYRLLAP